MHCYLCFNIFLPIFWHPAGTRFRGLIYFEPIYYNEEKFPFPSIVFLPVNEYGRQHILFSILKLSKICSMHIFQFYIDKINNSRMNNRYTCH